MQNLINILKEKQEDERLLKHKYDVKISEFLHSMNDFNIKYEIGWVNCQISLSHNLVNLKITHIHNDIIYSLLINFNISRILENRFYKQDLQFKQMQSDNVMLDPKIWIEMKDRLYSFIEEYFGFSKEDLK